MGMRLSLRIGVFFMDNTISSIKEKTRVALLSVFAAIFLTSTKIIVGLFTGSLGILSEALHAGLDLIAAAITYFSVRVSDKPADRDHNYGHGKIENIAALSKTLLLLLICTWVIYEAIHRLVTGNTHIDINYWSYAVVVTSIIIDFSRSRVLMKAAKKYKSPVLEADALHFSTDIWSSSAVLIGLVFANFGFFFVDAIAALLVASTILYVSSKLGKRSVDILIDKAPIEMVQVIENIVRGVPGVLRFHDVKVRNSGADVFIDLCIHVEPTLSVEQEHAISAEVERRICTKIERASVHVHGEPEENCAPRK